MEAKEQIKYKGWTLQTTYDDKILVKKYEEVREYDVDPIDSVEHDGDEYVILRHSDGSFTQIKFEEDDFLVIDKFDEDDEHIDCWGFHTFGEE